jgi:hypothetical protein
MLFDKSNRQGRALSGNDRNTLLGLQQQYDNAVYDFPAMTPTSGYLLREAAPAAAWGAESCSRPGPC